MGSRRGSEVADRGLGQNGLVLIDRCPYQTVTNSWGADKRLTLKIPRLEALIPTEIDGPFWFQV